MSKALAVQLDEQEQIIERALGTFIEVGQALRQIRDDRLYRERYATFEDYCRERWDFGRNYINKTDSCCRGDRGLGYNCTHAHHGLSPRARLTMP